MKTLLLGMVLGVAVVFAILYLYFSRGYAPVATAAPPMLFEETMAKMALKRPDCQRSAIQCAYPG